MGTKLDMASALKSCSVSSLLNRDVKQFSKKHLFDGQLETCWSSDQGSPQWILLTFKQPTVLRSLSIQFQGGFVGSGCSLVPDNGSPFDFYPEDNNALQVFQLPPNFSATDVKIIFSSSTDFFGRIVIYRLWFDEVTNP